MKVGSATISLSQVEYRQKGMSSLVQEEEDELEASYRMVQV